MHMYIIMFNDALLFLQSFNASLFSGKVLINPSNNMLAENLALVWSISVLYVLCSPVGVNRTLAARTTGRNTKHRSLNSKYRHKVH